MSQETTIPLYGYVGAFAEDKNKAKEIRTRLIMPALGRNETVVLDFEKVNSATQSFIHALISEVIRQEGIAVLDKLFFKNCNNIVREIVNIVIEYLQDTPKISDLPRNGNSSQD